MADATLQSLLQTKAALDLGLVSQQDYDAVKNSFLQAQKIKSAVDVGLIKPEDYEATKQSFLGSLTGAFAAPATAGAAAGGAPAAAAAAEPEAAPPPPAPRPPPVAWQLPPPASPKVAAAAQQAKADAAAAAAAAAPAAADSGGGMRRVASNPNVPTNIPRMGGIKKMAQGVRSRRLCSLPASESRPTLQTLTDHASARPTASTPQRRHRLLSAAPLLSPLPSAPSTHPPTPAALLLPSPCWQTSMSGIRVTDDAVNLFYVMRLKSTVGRSPATSTRFPRLPPPRCIHNPPTLLPVPRARLSLRGRQRCKAAAAALAALAATEHERAARTAPLPSRSTSGRCGRWTTAAPRSSSPPSGTRTPATTTSWRRCPTPTAATAVRAAPRWPVLCLLRSAACTAPCQAGLCCACSCRLAWVTCGRACSPHPPVPSPGPAAHGLLFALLRSLPRVGGAVQPSGPPGALPAQPRLPPALSPRSF